MKICVYKYSLVAHSVRYIRAVHQSLITLYNIYSEPHLLRAVRLVFIISRKCVSIASLNSR